LLPLIQLGEFVTQGRSEPSLCTVKTDAKGELSLNAGGTPFDLNFLGANVGWC